MSVKGPQLGFHVSISGSVDLAVDRAVELGCTTFQMFTRNPRQWNYRPLGEAETAAFIAKRRKAGFRTVVCHMPYLPNLASSDRATVKRSRESLSAEMARCGSLGIDYVVAHIGSHGGKGTAVGIRNVAEACNGALDANHNGTVLLIENMAGQSNCVGARFEELRMIIDQVTQTKRIGVCLDTCHLFACGFDISNKAGIEQTFDVFESAVGLRRLKVVHLNDSKGPLGGKLDRHEHIGMGKIGAKGFGELLHYDGIARLPLLMETPQDEKRSDVEEMAYVRKLIAS